MIFWHLVLCLYISLSYSPYRNSVKSNFSTELLTMYITCLVRQIAPDFCFYPKRSAYFTLNVIILQCNACRHMNTCKHSFRYFIYTPTIRSARLIFLFKQPCILIFVFTNKIPYWRRRRLRKMTKQNAYCIGCKWGLSVEPIAYDIITRRLNQRILLLSRRDELTLERENRVSLLV